MIDFTGCKRLVNNYDGADMKLRVEHDGQIYMLFWSSVDLTGNQTNAARALYNLTKVKARVVPKQLELG